MSALDRMERFVKDLSFRRLGMVGGVRKRFARPWQTPKAYNAEFVIEIGDTPYGKKGTWKQEIELGSEDGQYALSVLQSHSPSGGAILAVNSGEFFPSNYIGEQPGPYSVNSGSQVTVSKNAVVAIVSASTTLPAHLRSYVAEASQSS